MPTRFSEKTVSTSPERKSSAADFYASLKERASAIEARYRSLTPESARLNEEAQSYQPGGSTRDAVLRQPYAPFLSRGEGGWVTDADGRRITDLWFNASSLPLGHGDPGVLAAVREQLSRGTAFFAPTERDVEFARLLCQRLASAERVRFTNSGTEAVMVAIQIARGLTGREGIAKFEGSYHGTYDDVFWSVATGSPDIGPVDRPVPIVGSLGVPPQPSRTLVLPFNELGATEKLLEANAHRIAALLVEPVAHRMGLIRPEPGFLEGLRAICDRHGMVLIFDEVIAFRVGYHGAQGLLGVKPDLTVLGKIIGGGFPAGAVVGRAEVMAVTEPNRANRVPHFGTFSANPVSMVAGRATMEALTPEVFRELNTSGERIRRELRRIGEGLPLRVTGVGSLFKINATDLAVRDYRTALTVDRRWQELASLALLNEGFLLTTKLHGCVSLATTEEQIENFLSAFERLVRGGT